MNEIIKQEITLDELKPKVLVIRSYNTKPMLDACEGIPTLKRYVYDYEIEYFTDDGGVMIVDGNAFDILKGCLAFRRPGQCWNSIPHYSCWNLNLDLLGDSYIGVDNYLEYRFLKFQKYITNPLLDGIPSFMKIKNQKYILQLLTLIKLLTSDKSEHGILSLKIKVLELIKFISEEANDLTFFCAKKSQVIYDILDYMNKHFEEKITLQDLSRKTNYNPIYLHRFFRETTRKTPAQYLLQIRLEHAQYLLLNTDKAFAEIATDCGLNTPSYFCYVFKKQYNMTPNEFKSTYLLNDSTRHNL